MGGRGTDRPTDALMEGGEGRREEGGGREGGLFGGWGGKEGRREGEGRREVGESIAYELLPSSKRITHLYQEITIIVVGGDTPDFAFV